MTEHLYTPNDVKRIRDQLAKEQDNKDALTGLELPDKQKCLDHDHQSQFVRGVLHRQVNAALGKLEGVHTRYLSYWYEGTLPEFLRQAAQYLELEQDERYIHPMWIKKSCTMFNSLNEQGKKEVLHLMHQPQGSNATERKALFRKALLSKKFTFFEVKELIEERKKA